MIREGTAVWNFDGVEGRILDPKLNPNMSEDYIAVAIVGSGQSTTWLKRYTFNYNPVSDLQRVIDEFKKRQGISTFSVLCAATVEGFALHMRMDKIEEIQRGTFWQLSMSAHMRLVVEALKLCSEWSDKAAGERGKDYGSLLKLMGGVKPPMQITADMTNILDVREEADLRFHQDWQEEEADSD